MMIKKINQKKTNRSPAFTLIEVMISFVLSVFIMTMIMQSYNGISSALSRVRDRVRIVNRASLLTHQVEKDLSSLFIPFLQKKIEPESKDIRDKDAKEEGPPQKESEKDENKSEKKKKKDEEERRRRALIFSVYENEDLKVKDERWKLFKNFTGITTQPVVVYGQQHVRLVRIMYSLELDKENSLADKKSYILMRKQTTDLQNYELKKREDIDTLSLDKQQDLAIKEDIIADGIKDLFFQIITEKKENEGEGKSRKNEKKERELVSLFIWGDENEYGGDVPILITMRVSFWNNSQTDGIVFENAFPVYSYPTQDLITTTTVEQKEEDKKNESQPKEKQEGTGEAEK